MLQATYTWCQASGRFRGLFRLIAAELGTVVAVEHAPQGPTEEHRVEAHRAEFGQHYHIGGVHRCSYAGEWRGGRTYGAGPMGTNSSVPRGTR
jgi:hypothetical protein